MSFCLVSADADFTHVAVHSWWMHAASAGGEPPEGFNPHASFGDRCKWAIEAGYEIGTNYVRFSTQMQHSTEDQIRECMVWAANNKIYVPPELICTDEAVSGRKTARAGLDRVKAILGRRQATVLLVYKFSRLYRQAHKGFTFIQDEVVEAGLRAVSVSQGIDTQDKTSWKLQLQLHGIFDELLVDAIGDHVRAGLKGLFEKGWTTGAIGVGYRPKILPEAPLTNRGLPRTMPEIDPAAAELIREHARLLLEGVSVEEGWKRWVEAGGPCDPRSPGGQMSRTAYRRLFTNSRLTGLWEFGRKRNEFSSKRDYVLQVEQPESEVQRIQFEELRILDDETFFALKKKFDAKKMGPRGPRAPKQLQLWDLTTEFFFCVCCSTPEQPVRFYQVGARGKGMQCKRGALCPCKSAVRREEAVKSICKELSERIANDGDLIENAITESLTADAEFAKDAAAEMTKVEERIRVLTRRADGLLEMIGSGSEEDDKQLKAKIRSVQAERNNSSLQLAHLKTHQHKAIEALTPDFARKTVQEMSTLLQAAAAGELGEDAVYKALAVFRALTDGKIMVHIESRPGRSRTNVKGTFELDLLQSVERLTDRPNSESSGETVTVWLRKPPRLDELASPVHQLIDIDGLSYREAAKKLRDEGHKVNSGNVWYSYRRYYEMLGQDLPDVPYNNGNRRRPRE
ncbi:recombinase family protein [Rubinisphaera margarita]|uniref:recombinase family protein n=1 Tax=Rubinisphaera margarita TaxID=2909586 RepID=UPI001EE81194|nr:recombinase family protein [Rubinisphaera margarita]MCG6157270.1 recombinase family protein [Rubinisphaera margarita]